MKSSGNPLFSRQPPQYGLPYPYFYKKILSPSLLSKISQKSEPPINKACSHYKLTVSPSTP